MLTKIVYFNYAAAAVILGIVISAFFKKANKIKSTRIFLLLNYEIFATVCFDIFAVNFDNLGAGNVLGKYIAHGGYLILHTGSSLFFLLYVIALTDTYFKFKNSLAKKARVFLPMLIYVIVFIAGFYNKFPIYYINENDVYVRGPALIMGYIVGGYYLIYGIVYILKYRKLFTIKWIITLFSFYPIVLTAMVFEFFIPQLIIELFANAIALMLIALYVQKPEEVNEPVSRLGNIAVFNNDIKRNFLNEKEFVDVIVEVKNYSSLIKLINYEGQIKLGESIGDYFRALNSKYKLNADMYNSGMGRYHIVFSSEHSDKIEDLSETIHNYFNGHGLTTDVELPVQTVVCIVRAPEDIADFEAFRRFVTSDMSEFSDDEIVYASELLERDFYRMSLYIDGIVEEAITNNHLEVYYQPMYSFEKGRFVAAEALLRLVSPKYGTISTAVFIPAAERSGAIYKLWDFVIHSVCRFIASDEFKRSGIEFIDVNLSAIQCTRYNLADTIIEVVDKYGIPHNSINVEITETAFAYDPDAFRQNVDKLHAAGIGISLDDYGTGYSDTARVLELPLDVIKLDRSFVLFADDPMMRSVVRNTIRMLKEVNMTVIAEGVEDEHLLNTLKDMGCDIIQGWYYSKALPERNFIKFVEEF